MKGRKCVIASEIEGTMTKRIPLICMALMQGNRDGSAIKVNAVEIVIPVIAYLS